MKYIDADKLLAEIERLRKECASPISVCNDILSLIDELQQEQPDNEDIDKVAQELYEHLYELKRRNNVPTNLYDKQEIIDLWKAGIEYGRNHPKQEQPEVELEDIIRLEFGTRAKVEDGRRYVKLNWDKFSILARHFYSLGLNARNED